MSTPKSSSKKSKMGSSVFSCFGGGKTVDDADKPEVMDESTKTDFSDLKSSSGKDKDTMTNLSPRVEDIFEKEGYDGILEHTNPRVIEMLVNFAYDRKVDIDWIYVWELLELADRFDLVSLIEICLKHVIKTIAPNNCMKIYKHSTKTKLKDLKNYAMTYVLENFSKIDKHDIGFTSLPIKLVVSILSNLRLNASEEEVWDSALIWYDHDPIGRDEYILSLLGCTKLSFLNKKYFFEKVICHEEVIRQEDCRIFILDKYRMLTDLPVVVTLDLDTVSTPEIGIPRYPHDIMFVIGGCFNGQVTNTMCSYDRKADHWIKLPFGKDILQPRAYHSCVVFDKKICIIGGRNESTYLKSCQCFDVVTKKWLNIPSLIKARSSLCAAVLKNYIFAMCGSDSNGVLKSTEKYDLKTEEWELSSNLNVGRVRASAVSANSQIFVVGGCDGINYLNSVESYNFATDRWTFRTPMHQARSEFGLALFKDRIYAAGGYDGEKTLSSVEIFDYHTEIWTYIPEMKNPRCQFAIQALDDMLVVVGGADTNDKELQLVEQYDLTMNEWTPLGDCEITSVVSSGHCVVSRLYKQLHDYALHDRNKVLIHKIHYIARMKRLNRVDKIYRALSMYMN